MDYLPNVKPISGSVKLIDGTAMRVAAHIDNVNGDIKEKLEAQDIVKAFGVARIGWSNGKTHAVVIEGYIYEPPQGNNSFIVVGVDAYNSGCRNILDKYNTRLTAPTARITCTRCLKRIEGGIVTS